jgi:secreted trypsin-like serine protease
MDREDPRMRRRSMVRLVALLVVPLAAVGAGIFVATNANAIANGEVVPEGRYRFTVKLTMTGIPTADGGRRNSACSGALIDDQWVLTAGHCFRTFDNTRVEYPVADLTTATVGRADLNGTNGVVRTVVAVRQSPTNDVALAKLDQPVKGIKPIDIARGAPDVGDVVRLTGYGSTQSTAPVPSDLLRTGQLTVTEVQQSTYLMSGFAPQPDTTPCPYDSGGPYFVESRFRAPRVVAVVSNGPSCPHTANETAARVDNIRGWINPIVDA